MMPKLSPLTISLAIACCGYAAPLWAADAVPPPAGYEEYDEIVDLFAEYALAFPDIARVLDLPWMTSTNGLPLVVLEIGKPAAAGEMPGPGFVMTGGTHGDEWIGTAVALGLTHQLLTSYGTDPRLTGFVDSATVYSIPVTSPDSFHISREVHGVDPNQVFPYPGNEAEPSIASARNLLKFFEMFGPAGSVDFHGVGGLILHPWGYTCAPIEDAQDLARYQRAGAAMAATNGYIWGDVCNTLYQNAGGSQDGYYHRFDTLSFSIETGATSKKPPPAEIPAVQLECGAAAWTLLEHVIAHANDDDAGGDDDDSPPGDDTNTGGDGPSESSATSDSGGTQPDPPGPPSGTSDAGGGDDDETNTSSCAGCRNTSPAGGWTLAATLLALVAGPSSARRATRHPANRKPGSTRQRGRRARLCTWVLGCFAALGASSAGCMDRVELANASDPSATSWTGDSSSSTATAGPVEPLPPVDCNHLPSLPATYRQLDYVPGCEDFTFDGHGNLVCITKARALVRVPHGGPAVTVVPKVGSGASFTRGTRFLPDGDLLLADPDAAAIMRLSPDGLRLDTILSGVPNPNGISIGFDGYAYLSLLSGQIWRIDPATGAHTVLVDATTPARRFDGIALHHDANQLYFNTEDALEVFRLDLESLVDPQLVVTIESDQGTSVPALLDGMAVDECGNVYVAEMHGVVHRISPDGQLDVVADMTEHYPAFITALNFGSGIGGWHAHTLHVMVIQDGMYAIDLGVGGQAEPHLASASLTGAPT